MKKLIVSIVAALTLTGCASTAAQPAITSTVTAISKTTATTAVSVPVTVTVTADPPAELMDAANACQRATHALLATVNGRSKAMQMNDSILNATNVAEGVSFRDQRDQLVADALDQYNSVKDDIDLCRNNG